MNLEEQQNAAYKKAIIAYLNNRVKTDEYLLTACKKESKTLDGVIAYVKSEARKQAEDGVACIEDNTVYEWAVHYILEDSLNFEQSKTAKKVSNRPEMTQEVNKKGEEVEHEKTIKEQKDDTIYGQLDLF